ncbi:DedA protein [Candidatus Rhodobacter oscarellae]|uniref:DedA protein n=1 Tax=Candidatus Rhodobacter oscarellae TaxID=1675527 RepID=A0A0J9E2W7_9RHOB|nr:VTT domain-containing protein [Candidatus Rhodobacter lobularis]KMW57075.1 DedA protein [Candidatus Rhodobacter lobularis]
MIDALAQYLPVWGYALLVVFNAVGRCGIPLPSSALMLMLGALVVGGPTELGLAIALGYGAALAGDLAAYPLGRWGGARLGALTARRPKVAALMASAEALAARWGALAVLITRWPLSTLGPYVNLVAGAVRMPLGGYIGWCLVGELIWVSLYLSLGYGFAASLDWILARAGQASQAALLVAGLAALLVWRIARRRRALPPKE